MTPPHLTILTCALLTQAREGLPERVRGHQGRRALLRDPRRLGASDRTRNRGRTARRHARTPACSLGRVTGSASRPARARRTSGAARRAAREVGCEGPAHHLRVVGDSGQEVLRVRFRAPGWVLRPGESHLSFSRRREQRLDERDESRDVHRRSSPHLEQIHVVVAVDQAIAHPRHPRPRKSRLRIAEAGRYPLGRFAEDRERMEHGGLLSGSRRASAAMLRELSRADLEALLS